MSTSVFISLSLIGQRLIGQKRHKIMGTQMIVHTLSFCEGQNLIISRQEVEVSTHFARVAERITR